MPQITVAIVTARETQDTHYSKWRDIRRSFLNREIKSKYLNGEFGALLAAVLDEDLDNHVEYQLRALEKGTRQPDRVIIVDRMREEIPGVDYLEYNGHHGIAIAVNPMMSARELELMPEAALSHILLQRKNGVSLGCSDKNTAIVLCETDYLLMLDDCCLPGFGLVQAAYEACDEEQILLVSHQQMYVKGDEFEVAQANWGEYKIVYTVAQAKELRRVFGVWAMPLSCMLALNGFNTTLDGDRGGLDVELIERMDRYAQAASLEYCIDPRARIYEIGHELPWGTQSRDDTETQTMLPTGWSYKAPGPSLKGIRDALGIQVGSDIFDLEGQAEHAEQSERLGDIIDDVLDGEEDDE